MINKMTALMTTCSMLCTLDSDPIISFSVHFYLIDCNIRNI